MNLPDNWGMPLGWSLASVPVLLILLGFLFNLLWKSRGMPFKMVGVTYGLYILLSSILILCSPFLRFQHFSRSFKPTDIWYENEHRELMQMENSPKDSPILAYKRGVRGLSDKNITEV